MDDTVGEDGAISVLAEAAKPPFLGVGLWSPPPPASLATVWAASSATNAAVAEGPVDPAALSLELWSAPAAVSAEGGRCCFCPGAAVPQCRAEEEVDADAVSGGRGGEEETSRHLAPES